MSIIKSNFSIQDLYKFYFPSWENRSLTNHNRNISFSDDIIIACVLFFLNGILLRTFNLFIKITTIQISILHEFLSYVFWKKYCFYAFLYILFFYDWLKPWSVHNFTTLLRIYFLFFYYLHPTVYNKKISIKKDY